MLRLCLCLLLLCASTNLLARDTRMQSANGEEGTCPAADDDGDNVLKPAVTRAVAPAKQVKPPTTVRGGDSARTHGPRWHSFLPGMFR